MTNIQGLAHVAIMAEDYERTIQCYTELFSFTLGHHWKLEKYNIEDASMLVSPDKKTCIEVFDRNASVAGEGIPASSREEIRHGALLHFSLYVKDVDEIVEQAKSFGLNILNPKEYLSLGHPPLEVCNALIEGPSGEVIEVLQEIDFLQFTEQSRI